jgi:hypothetical protein
VVFTWRARLPARLGPFAPAVFRLTGARRSVVGTPDPLKGSGGPSESLSRRPPDAGHASPVSWSRVRCSATRVQHIHCLVKLSCCRCLDRSIFHQARHYIAPVRQDRPRSIHRWFSTRCRTEPTSTTLLGFTYPSQYCSCSRAPRCFHRSGPTCRFAYPASTVFVEGSVAPPSHPLSQAADHGGSPRLLGRTREQSVPVDRVTSRQADAAMGFASCRFSGTLLAQHDFDPLIRLPNLFERDSSTNSAIQRTTGDRVISLRKPLPAPIRSWVCGDFRNECDFRRHLFPSVRCLPHRTHHRPFSVLRG